MTGFAAHPARPDCPQDLPWHELSARLRSRIQPIGFIDRYRERLEAHTSDVGITADIEDQAGFDYSRRVAPGLIELLYLDSPESVLPITDHLMPASFPIESMWAAARANTAHEPIDHAEPLPTERGPNGVLLEGDSLFIASKLADAPTLIRALCLSVDVPMIFAIPTPHHLVCQPIPDADSIVDAFWMVAGVVYQLTQEDGSLSPELFVWDDGVLQLLATLQIHDDGTPEYRPVVGSGAGEALDSTRFDSADPYGMDDHAVGISLRSRVIDESRWRTARRFGLVRDYAWRVADGLVEVLSLALEEGDLPMLASADEDLDLESWQVVGRENSRDEAGADLTIVDTGVDLGFRLYRGTGLADLLTHPRELLRRLTGEDAPALICVPARHFAVVHRYVDDETVDQVVPVMLGSARVLAGHHDPVSPDVFAWDGTELRRFAHIDTTGEHVWIPHPTIGSRSMYWIVADR